MNDIKTRSFILLALLSACSGSDVEQAPVRTTPIPRFETRIEIDTGTGTHSDFVAVDLNNDKWVDLAVVGISGELQIMLGNNSVFSSGQTLDLGGIPVWIASGDLDGDNDIDLAVVRTQAEVVTVLLNDGNARFEVAQELPVGGDALALLIADADDDGIPDIIVSRPKAPEIQVFLNDGTGLFEAGSAFVLPGGGSPFTMTVGDVTRDGLADLIVSDPLLERLLVFPGNAVTADFESVPVSLPVAGSPKACALGDLNGDGLTDMAVSAFDANEFVVITDFSAPVGGPVALTSFSIPLSGPPSLSTIGDVTGDGRPDLIACVLRRAAMVVVPQLPGGGLGEEFQLDATGMPLRPVLADVDNNGRQDLLVMSGLNTRINLWLAQDNGELVGARNWDTGLAAAAYAVTHDVDGDGVNEIIVGDQSSSALVIMHEIDGKLVPESRIELGSDVFNARLVDLDSDGRMDLIVPVGSGVKILRNHSRPGAMDFEVLPGLGSDSFGLGSGPFGVTAADLNSDGLSDLAMSDFSTGQLQIMLSSESPFEFAAPVMWPVGSGPVDVVAAEFTGDGIVDLAVSRSTKSDIVLFENDGKGNLRQLISLPVGQSPNYLLTSDFNLDGRADIVVSNGLDHSVSVLFGGPSGFISQSYPAGRTPTALLCGDMNGDGAPDILVTSLVGGDFRILVNDNDGSGRFSNVLPFPGTIGASGGALGDIDGDGYRDLVIASLITNRVSLVRGLGTR